MSEQDSTEQAQKEESPYSCESLKKFIKAAKKAQGPHWKDSQSAYDEFEYQKSVADEGKGEEIPPCYPIYFSRVDTLIPKYYGQSPTIKAKRKFDISDSVALLMAKIVERLSDYNIENGNFDATMFAFVSDVIHACNATAQIVYEADERKVPVRKILTKNEQDQFFEGENPYTGKEEIFLDPQTQQFFYNGFDVEYVNKKLYAKQLAFDDVVHTPDAKDQTEVNEIGVRFQMPKEDALARFGEDKLAGYSWKTGKYYSSEDKKDTTSEESKIGQYLEGFEIECKKNKTIYWVCEELDQILDERPSNLNLRNFYSSIPFVITSKPRKSLNPTPTFIRLRATTNQLHKQYGKVFSLIDSIRRRALIDSAVEPLIEAIESLESEEFVSVENLQELVEKKGLQNLIWYIPVQELVDAISELSAIEEKFKALFDEWYGTPDIIRGASDPIETAKAQTIKVAAVGDRFRLTKEQIEEASKNLAELLLDASLTIYDENEIASIVGLKYMTQKEQQEYPEAIARLKDDKERLISLEVETNSTSFIDNKRRQEEINAVVAALIPGIQQIAALYSTAPGFALIAFKALVKTLESLPQGRDFVADVEQEVRQLFESEMKKSDVPQGPNYEQMKLDLKKYELDIKANKDQADSQIKALRLELDKQRQAFLEYLETGYFNIDKFKASTQHQEMVSEETRLAREAEADLLKTELPKESKAPSTVVQVNVPTAPTLTTSLNGSIPTYE